MESSDSNLFDYDNEKPTRYFSAARRDFVEALRTNAESKILEIGCADGGTGALALESKKCSRYVGVDVAPKALERADEVLNETHLGNVEVMEFPWPLESFDALIMSEVLEHLIDPWQTLTRLSSLLKPKAQLLISSPNIASLLVLNELLRGRFDYTESGVMDRTHLRWFTPSTYRQLVESSGFEVESCRALNISPSAKHWKGRLFNRVTHGRYEFLFWKQIAIYAVKQSE